MSETKLKCIHCTTELLPYGSESVICPECKIVSNKEYYEQMLGMGKQNTNGWVKCSERLPTKTKRYLVIHLDDNNAWNDDRLGFSTFWAETKEFNHDNIGWWFELPELPLPENENE